MRYTTVIDLRDYPQAYKSQSVRILYLHMCLTAGYHEEDRDIVTISIRRLAMSTGLTVSATRHAMAVLEHIGLLKKTTRGLLVTKWVASEQIQARPSSKPAKADPSLSRAIREQEQREEAYARKVEQAVRQLPVEELEKWLQELDEGRSLRHGGVSINASKKNTEWLKKWLNYRKKNG